MNAHSLRSMAEDKNNDSVKRDNLFKVDPRMITEEEGFNLRDYEDPEVQEHIRGFASSYENGKYVPPLLVRVNDAGQITVVEGHCRRLGALMAIARGVNLQYVEANQFRGNDKERVEVMLRSAEGLRLKPLKMAIGFQRLTRQGHTSKSIATEVMSGKITQRRVDQLLALAEANYDVHELVQSGAVTADVAIEALREHGERTGEFLKNQLTRAASIGKNRVTMAVINGPRIPARSVNTFVSTVRTVVQDMPSDTRRQLTAMANLEEEELKDKKVEVDAAFLMSLLKADEQMKEEERKAAERLDKRRAAVAQGSLEVAETAGAEAQ